MTTNKPEVVSVYNTATGESEEVIHLSDYERLQAECEELSTALAESRANDRQAMAYLEAVRGIVGGSSFPEMIGLVKELLEERDQLLAAIRRLCNIYVVDGYYEGEMREKLLDEAVNRAIERGKENRE